MSCHDSPLTSLTKDIGWRQVYKNLPKTQANHCTNILCASKLQPKMCTCDFAVEGSPRRRTLISPLSCTPSGSLCSPNTKWWPHIKTQFDWMEKPFNSMSSTWVHNKVEKVLHQNFKLQCQQVGDEQTLRDPLKRRQATAFFTSSWPNIDGAIKRHISWYASGLRAKSLNSMSWE
jgi:hypothetical protein